MDAALLVGGNLVFPRRLPRCRHSSRRWSKSCRIRPAAINGACTVLGGLTTIGANLLIGKSRRRYRVTMIARFCLQTGDGKHPWNPVILPPISHYLPGHDPDRRLALALCAHHPIDQA